eukprot:TRINITY_DN102241_c0_g1_i1.p1 TRINITY_DN102241_c0_g1~~TRINITY_DN102241_c0_g1_i1.p1  ORF type:complete len:336 (+),score=69.05 TRINITY_DN102241_c0_g1_i1:47-1054(+)
MSPSGLPEAPPGIIPKASTHDTKCVPSANSTSTFTMPQAQMPSGPPKGPPETTLPTTLPPGISRPDLDSLPKQEVMVALSEKVHTMLAAATQASEKQVSSEMRRLEIAIAGLAAKASQVETLLNRQALEQEPPPGSSAAVTQGHFSRVLAEVERRWDEDLKDLKRELHQTILAHNHNADLMADHKAAIDQIKFDIDAVDPAQSQLSAGVHSAELRRHLDQIIEALTQDALQNKDVDALLDRGNALLQRLPSLSLAGGGNYEGYVPPHEQGPFPGHLPGMFPRGHTSPSPYVQSGVPGYPPPHHHLPPGGQYPHSAGPPPPHPHHFFPAGFPSALL